MRGQRDRGGRTAVAGLLAVALGTAVAHGAIGDLDASFAGSGVVVTQLGQGGTPLSEAIDAKLQPDGKLVVSGAASDSMGNVALALARYLPSGAFDTTFGPGGTGSTVVQFGTGPSPSSIALFSGLALQPDGRIVACGVATDGSGNENVLVARFTAAGAVDPSFGTGGRVLVQLGTAATPASNLYGCTVQSDGKIVGVGGRNDSGGTGTVVVRLNPDGGLDPSFASGGVFSQQLGAGAMPTSVAADVVVQADGRIVFSMAASDSGGAPAMAIGRLTPTGSLDPSFGSGGVTITTFPSTSPSSEGVQLAVQPSGKFVVSGDGRDSMGDNAFVMARYTSGGALDTTFGSGGRVVSQLSAAATPSSTAIGLVVQPNGKPVLLGNAVDALGNTPMVLARYNVDGGFFDPAFGAGGIVTRQFASGGMPITTPIGGVFTPSGRLIVVGAVGPLSAPSWFVSSFIADQPPTATFTFAPAAPVVGDTITLDASGSHDDDGAVTQIAWDLNGDGTAGDASGPATTTSFTTGGMHRVTVVVTDDDGLEATAAADLPVGCGTAQSFISVACRLADLIAQVDAGVPAGKVHDKLRAALASAEMHVATAAGLAPGKARKKEIGKAVTAFGHFVSAARSGKRAIPKPVRDALLNPARELKTAIKKLRTT